MKSRKMYFRAIDDNKERNGFEMVNYEWGAAQEQFRNSRMRITKRLWDSWGKELVNAGNEVLDMFAMGGSMRNRTDYDIIHMFKCYMFLCN